MRRAQPKVESFRHAPFRLCGGFLVPPSLTFPQASRFIPDGAKASGSSSGDPPIKDQRHLFGTTNVQMVSDYPFKPHPPGLRSVKDTGLGDLELAEGQLVGVTGLEVLGAEGRRQTPPPTPEEAAHGPRTQPITGALQRFGIGARAESVVQGLLGDARFLQLPLGPLVAVEPPPDRIRRVGVGLPKRATPLGVPEVEVEVVDVGHLTAPLHMRMRRRFLSFALPGTPHRCFLLSNADQHHPLLPFLRRHFQGRDEPSPPCFPLS